MARDERYFSADVEASGPIPGPWWMPSFGVCPTDDLHDGFKALLKPLYEIYPKKLDGIIQDDIPGAMRVVAEGTPGFTWDGAKTDDDNCADLYEWYMENGEDPREVFPRFQSWLRRRAGELGLRPYVVGAPLSFDFMWLYWYYQFVMDKMPEFGFSGLDMRSYFMGMHGMKGLKSNKRAYKKKYPTSRPHNHDPLCDAQEQGEIFHKMIEDRAQKKLIAKQQSDMGV